jgi:hypothetical protein
MVWSVEQSDDFHADYEQFEEAVQDEILALSQLLREFGPYLKRPNCDTLSSSNYPNMKELRFSAAHGAWRLAFAFDPKRSAILLVAGSKSGLSQQLFYKRLIAQADKRFAAHLEKLKRKDRKQP